MPNFDIEKSIDKVVVGIDEAGRGPWAGPVVAGAVVFHSGKNVCQKLLSSLDDSKKLSAKKREELYTILFEEKEKGNLDIGIGLASAQEIDDINILQATFMAMDRAAKALSSKPEHAIIDGNLIPKKFSCACQPVIKGDSKSLSISAASIVAKVYRDRLMKEIGHKHPEYGFDSNSGYGTKKHIEALKKYGITQFHRKSYKPIKEIL